MHVCMYVGMMEVRNNSYLIMVFPKYRKVPRISSPPSAPTKKNCLAFKRAYLRNHERSCVPFFKIMLEYHSFPEMWKQVRGSVNHYEDTLV